MTEELSLLRRIGSVGLIVGGVAVFAFRFAHGDLPAADPAAALAFIAARSIYAPVHLGAILGVVVWVGGLVALANVLSRPVGREFGRLGVASALVGAAIYIVDFSIDGYAGRDLAAQWATASPAGRANFENAANTVFQMLGGTSLISIAILWGLPLVLFGIALAHDSHSPWLAWTGVIIGAVTVLAAVAQYLRPDFVPGVWIYGGLVSLVQLWSVILGGVLWRRADTVEAG